MFKKKQVLAVVSIAIISFVIGSMFNVMALVSGRNPWDKVWTNINELQATVDALEAKVETLEGQLPPQGFLTAPAYDSGWMPIAKGEIIHLDHNLNTEELFVYILGKDGFSIEWLEAQGIHQTGLNFRPFMQDGLWWCSNSTTITIRRGAGDSEVGFSYVYVMIWRISEP